jgi:hypothetical protein
MAIQYAGGTNINTTFSGATKASIQSGIQSALVSAGWTNLSGATGSGTGPGKVATFTVTIASPGVVTLTGHGFLGGERVNLFTTGALPTGLAVNTLYFVKYIDGNTFNLATTLGGANINTSGTQSGTHTLATESILLQSAATAQGLAVNVRVKDDRNNCVHLSIESTSGLLVGGNSTTNGCHLLATAGRTYQIICSRYQFAIFVPATFGTARTFAAGGVLYIPSPNSVPANAGWLIGDSYSDSLTTLGACWRAQLGQPTGGTGNQQLMYGANLWEVVNTNADPGTVMQLVAVSVAQASVIGGITLSSQPSLYRWASGDIITSDPLVSWSLTGVTDEPMIRGQLWDALIIQDSIAGDATFSFDSHNWFNLTNSNTGTRGTSPRGSFALVIP